LTAPTFSATKRASCRSPSSSAACPTCRCRTASRSAWRRCRRATSWSRARCRSSRTGAAGGGQRRRACREPCVASLLGCSSSLFHFPWALQPPPLPPPKVRCRLPRHPRRRAHAQGAAQGRGRDRLHGEPPQGAAAHARGRRSHAPQRAWACVAPGNQLATLTCPYLSGSLPPPHRHALLTGPTAPAWRPPTPPRPDPAGAVAVDVAVAAL
jgi:hypothetical protein